MGRPPIISREQILQSARSLFTLKGFASATLADIAGELHVTPAAILRHFDSKQALFEAAMHTKVKLPQCILDLQTVNASADPRVVLRRVAEEWVPFARTTIVQHLVVTMHEQTNPTLVMPFDPRSEDSPPKRGLKIVTRYFRRAKEAGVVQIKDPRAAALLFMGSLLSYVFIHHVLKVVDTPYPLDDYVDALLDLWSHGAIEPKKHGGSRGRKEVVPSQKNRADRDHRRRRDRSAAVHAAEAQAEAARSGRHARGEDSERRLARRRPRDSRSHR
ncbi:MAG TPA: TetR/AcrR family transcriptional regulator [Thermoanaerobaculia bacterium]|jgi:AcrR family transcriptional regulator|nr:TetR/AcrR family transcriptional regulator [Thermoanaerobaculia bacterium]